MSSTKDFLFISPSFFEYDSLIKRNLQIKYQCDFIFYEEACLITNRSSYVPFYLFAYLLLCLFPESDAVKSFYGRVNLARKDFSNLNSFLQEEIRKKDQDYNKLIFVKASGLKEETYTEISKKNFISKTLILYDPHFRFPDSKIEFFDSIFSTELNECQVFGWSYQGLFSSFYNPKDDIQNCTKDYFISFIGAFSFLRLFHLIKIQIRLLNKSKNNLFILVTNFAFKDFYFFGIKITKHHVNIHQRKQTILDSNYILSIEEPGQWGWTGRIADTVCLGGKLISNSNYLDEWKALRGFDLLPAFSFDEALSKTDINLQNFDKSVFNIELWLENIIKGD
ncbi:hypothetical protein OAH24_02350 [Gammaproteobacteria bacterium]|nr:hypothetical protein [Gammaproteobacteria bacterium]